MIKIIRINDISEIKFQDVTYPVIEAEIIIDDEEYPINESFGPESLGKALMDDNGNVRTREAYQIDLEIYAYVPDDLHAKTHQEIKEWIEKEID